MIGGSREFLRETSLEDDGGIAFDKMGSPSAIKKTSMVVILSLCIGLIITLSVLLGVFSNQEVSSCVARSEGS